MFSLKEGRSLTGVCVRSGRSIEDLREGEECLELMYNRS